MEKHKIVGYICAVLVAGAMFYYTRELLPTILIGALGIVYVYDAVD